MGLSIPQGSRPGACQHLLGDHFDGHFTIAAETFGLSLKALRRSLPGLPTVVELHDGLKKTLWKVTRVLVFLQVTCLGWLIFRATSVSQVGDLLEAMISAPLRLTLDFPKSNLGLMLWLGMTLAAVQIYAAWRRDDFFFLNWPAFFRGALYAALLLLILFLGEYGGADFIYFQF